MSSPPPPTSVRAELLKLKAVIGSGEELNWTLAQDTALFKALETFSADFERRTSQLAASLDDFGLDVARAHVKLSNASNELSALSRTQFMEHRVYEEAADDTAADETPAASIVQAPKTEEEQQAALVRECASLVQLGLNAMGAFPLDDEELEDEAAAPPLPGHSYVDLALPFVIGTPEFLADDTCGLFEPDERETMRTTMETGAEGDEDGTEESEEDEEDDEEDEEVEDEEELAASRGRQPPMRAGRDSEDDEESDDDYDDDFDDSESAVRRPTPAIACPHAGPPRSPSRSQLRRLCPSPELTGCAVQLQLTRAALPSPKLTLCVCVCARARARALCHRLPP